MKDDKFEADFCWHITFSTNRRRPIFDAPDLAAICATTVKDVCNQHGYRVFALAFMPDHVHMVVSSGSSSHALSKMMNHIKGVASRRLSEATPELKFDLASTGIWTEGYHARVLANDDSVRVAIKYVDDNPARVGLPPQNWEWLSPL